MVRLVYGHLVMSGHRAEAVGYRVQRHAAKFGERLNRIWVSGKQTGKQSPRAES